MAARALRYDWFEKIRKEVGASAIATAHHLNDQVETVLLNLTRGTGLKGLSGISPKNEKVVRPLLEITKAELLQYAEQHKIDYREDLSNASDDYQRNLLRHHVVEVLKQINPSLENTFGDFVGFMDDYNVLLKEQLDTLKKKCTSEKNGIFEIKFGFIKRHLAGRTILFHILSEFGFNAAQCTLIFDSFKIAANTGQQFFSTTHRLVVDRRSMFVILKDIERENYLKMDKIPQQIVFNNYKIQCTVVPVQEVNIKTSPRYAYVDMDVLEFPLMLRYYKEGDYFYPFGMSKPKTPGKVGKKKVSKFFKDEKIPQFDKENTAMLFSGERLVWLLGHRMDDRFKVTPKTKHVLKLVLVDDEVGA
jgi:tRNA(Ile)-lysidine synthase